MAFKSKDKTWLMDFSGQYYILKIRPFLREFLENSSKKFEIFVYTFGTREYALRILSLIDSKEEILKTSRLITRNESPLEYKQLNKILPEKFKR